MSNDSLVKESQQISDIESAMIEETKDNSDLVKQFQTLQFTEYSQKTFSDIKVNGDFYQQGPEEQLTQTRQLDYVKLQENYQEELTTIQRKLTNKRGFYGIAKIK